MGGLWMCWGLSPAPCPQGIAYPKMLQFGSSEVGPHFGAVLRQCDMDAEGTKTSCPCGMVPGPTPKLSRMMQARGCESPRDAWW